MCIIQYHIYEYFAIKNVQGRATITPSSFLEVGCYSVLGALFRDFSSVGCYSRSLARPNKGKLGVIEGHL